jgi:cytochrome c
MMKRNLTKTLMLLIAAAWLAGCEEKVDYKKEESKSMSFDVDKDLQSALQQKRMPLLAVTLGCNNCHSLDHKIVGPAWENVGKHYRNVSTYKYKGKSYPLTDGLVQKISHGGSGNWGVEAMPALDPSGSKKAELGKLVNFILKLGKQ